MSIDHYTDREIVEAILRRDSFVTREYLYKKCYPLFKAVYDKYYTDCESCLEFINEIYSYIMMPRKNSQANKLAGFEFRCTLTMWLKIVSENFCHQLYSRRGEIIARSIDSGDRNALSEVSLEERMQALDADDVSKILASMPNGRYRKLMELRYVDGKTNEETAMLLDMTMANYYNKHKLAKAQFCEVLRKEGLL